jgi:integrase
MKCYEKTRLRKPLILKAGNVPIKIYQSRSRQYARFVVSYYLAGKRVLETFAKLPEAKARAQEVVSAILSNQIGALTLTGSDRDRYTAALALLTPFNVPLQIAVQEYVAALSELRGQPLLSAVKDYTRRHTIVEKRVREVVDEILAAKARDGARLRYIQTIRGALNRFAAGFETNISSISSPLIADWIHAQNVGPCARNGLRTSIVLLFRFARSRGYLPKHQTTEADEVPRAKYRGGKIGILTPDQLACVITKVDEEAKLYLSLGAFTGIRSAELIRLAWEDISFERGHIEVGKDKAKTATRRLVPIQPNLIQWIVSYRDARGRVFPGEGAADRTIKGAKKIIGQWPTNALRHSYATYRLAQCHDAARVALEMGNSPQMLFRNYRELADEQDATAWFSIEPKSPGNVIALADTAALRPRNG